MSRYRAGRLVIFKKFLNHCIGSFHDFDGNAEGLLSTSGIIIKSLCALSVSFLHDQSSARCKLLVADLKTELQL